MDRNRRLLLRERPAGRVSRDHFDLDEQPVPAIGEGEALIRTTWISLDPANRVWMSDVPTYMPPVGIGEVMRALGLGRVVASRHDGYREGQLVHGFTGWQDYVVASDANPMFVVPDELADLPPAAHLGTLGLSGMTAFFGLTDVARVQEGETVVVSAAAGAVGSVAGQVATILGARAVGIAGTDEKCAWLTDELGFAAAINHRADDWRQRLADATPDGIDVDFENVGGEIMEAVFARLNLHARVALCGLISGYNDPDPSGPRNLGVLIARRVTVQGFLVRDYTPRFAEGTAQLAAWLREGRLQHRETVLEGLEQAPDALNVLFDGGNTGKLVVHVGD